MGRSSECCTAAFYSRSFPLGPTDAALGLGAARPGLSLGCASPGGQSRAAQLIFGRAFFFWMRCTSSRAPLRWRRQEKKVPGPRGACPLPELEEQLAAAGGAEGGTLLCGKAIIKFLLPALLSEEEGVSLLLPPALPPPPPPLQPPQPRCLIENTALLDTLFLFCLVWRRLLRWSGLTPGTSP